MQRFLSLVLRSSFALGLLWLSLSGPAQGRESSILVLGDSISAAYGMSLNQGWVALMADKLAVQHPQYAVVNASISGETTAGGLRRLPPLLQEHQPSLVIIELGANDGLRGFPLARLRGNLADLVEMSQHAGARVILLPMEIPPNYGARYTTGFRQSFQQVAADTGSTLAPFVLDGVATNPALMQSDRLHPAANAQSLLLDNVLPTVIEVLANQ